MQDKFSARISRASKRLSFKVCAGIAAFGMVGAVASLVWHLATDSTPKSGYVGKLAIALLSTMPFGFLGAIGMFGIIWIILRSSGADRVVIWLRRFHQVELTRLPLDNYLSMVGISSFQTATIQDTRFKTSYQTGATRSAGCLLGLGVFFFVPSFFLMALVGLVVKPLFVAAGIFGRPVSWIILFLIWMLFQFVLTRSLAHIIAGRRGVVRLKNSGDIREIVQWIDRVHSGIGHIFPGLKIFSCGDGFWMDAVQTLLDHCDAAIIDVSDLNENMCWELGQCKKSITAEKLILAYAVPPELYPSNPSDSLIDTVAELIGDEKLQYVTFLPYPEPLEMVGKRAKLADDVKCTFISILEQTLDEALSCPSRNNVVHFRT